MSGIKQFSEVNLGEGLNLMVGEGRIEIQRRMVFGGGQIVLTYEEMQKVVNAARAHDLATGAVRPKRELPKPAVKRIIV